MKYLNNFRGGRMSRKARRPLLPHEEKRAEEIKAATALVFSRMQALGLKTFNYAVCRSEVAKIGAKFRASPGSDQYPSFLTRVKNKVQVLFRPSAKKSRIKRGRIIGPTAPLPGQRDWSSEEIGNPN